MIENKINELNLIEIEETSPLYEFRNRINKYTNAILQEDIPFGHFDGLLSDFETIKSGLSGDSLEKSELIYSIKESIREELSKL